MSTMTPKQLKSALVACIPAGVQLMITGRPGIGKSSIIESACNALGYDLVTTYAALKDVTDSGGIPWPDASTGSVRYLPAPEIADLCNATRPTVWFLDDFGQAVPAVQASYMQWFLSREVHGKRLPDHVTIVMATNRRQDRAAVSGILEPVKGRYHSIIELQYSPDDHRDYMLKAGHPASVIAFCAMRPDLLIADEPPAAEIVKNPSPRGVAQLAAIEALDLPADVRTQLVLGSNGPGFGAEYLAFCRQMMSMVNVDEILLDAANARIPSKPDVCYATAIALATRAEINTMDAIATYCQRWAQSGGGEYVMLCVKDAIRKNAQITTTNAYQQLIAGPVREIVFPTL